VVFCEVEEDRSRILVFLVFLSIIGLFLSSVVTGVSLLKGEDLGDSVGDEHVGSGAGLLLLTLCSCESDMFAFTF